MLPAIEASRQKTRPYRSFFSSRRRHTRCLSDWSSDVCSSDLSNLKGVAVDLPAPFGMATDVGRDTVFRMTLQGPERRYWVSYGDLANFTFAAPPGNFGDGRGELFLGGGNAVLPATKGDRKSTRLNS